MMSDLLVRDLERVGSFYIGLVEQKIGQPLI